MPMLPIERLIFWYLEMLTYAMRPHQIWRLLTWNRTAEWTTHPKTFTRRNNQGHRRNLSRRDRVLAVNVTCISSSNKKQHLG